MIKKISILVVLLYTFILSISTASAHPWNTSWDGCHYCKTNCGKWGYTYGTRHCSGNLVPQFGPADPMYYGNVTETTESWQDICDRKYPGTSYKFSGDMCVCSNGVSWSKSNQCKSISCMYVNGTKAKTGDKSTNGYVCGSNSSWKKSK